MIQKPTKINTLQMIIFRPIFSISLCKESQVTE